MTIWDQRYFKIPDDTPEDKIIEATEEVEGWDHDYLLDTSEDLTPEENGGCSTIEVYNENHEIIYQNGKP